MRHGFADVVDTGTNSCGAPVLILAAAKDPPGIPFERANVPSVWKLFTSSAPWFMPEGILRALIFSVSYPMGKATVAALSRLKTVAACDR